ncbi:MAG: hypothetical protein ACLPSH_18465 [Vulcanimicrobiaceae bacterium]
MRALLISAVIALLLPAEAKAAGRVDPCLRGQNLMLKATAEKSALQSADFLSLAAENFEACAMTYDEPDLACNFWMEAADAYVSSVERKDKGERSAGSRVADQIKVKRYLRALDLYDLVAFRFKSGQQCEGPQVDSARHSAQTLQADLEQIDWRSIRFR